MSIRAPKAGIPTLERPRAAEHPRRPRGGWVTGIGIALIVALLVGLAGYSLGRGEESTRTVTRTVPPTAYTKSPDIQAYVVFTGDRCAYSGPTEVKAGTQVTFNYYRWNPSFTPPKGVTRTQMAVGPLDPGTTWEDVAQATTASSPPPFLIESEEFPPGESWTTEVTEGLWGIWCLTSPRGPNEGFAGAILRVVEG